MKDKVKKVQDPTEEKVEETKSKNDKPEKDPNRRESPYDRKGYVKK